jgi:hypothetical protein
VTEIHHFPDSRIADIFYQLAVDEALELHVAGEAQVCAIEPRQLGQEILEPAGGSCVRVKVDFAVDSGAQQLASATSST